MLGGIGLQELFLLFLIFSNWVVILFPCWRVFAEAGFPRWYSLSQIVPVPNIIMLYYSAFAERPIQHELYQMKRHSCGGVNEIG